MASDLKVTLVESKEGLREPENGFPLALVGAAFGGGVLFLALLVSLVVCIAKWKKRRDIRKAPRVDTIDIYGTYDTTGVTSDYNTLLETD